MCCPTKENKRNWWPFVATMAFVILIRLFVFELCRVDGQSMEPTYHSKALLGVCKLHHSYEVGDVVVLKDPVKGRTLIKRIVAKPFDEVKIKEDALYVNGKLVSSYGKGKTIEENPKYSYMMLQDGEYYVLGDNREDSLDSRSFGGVKSSSIIGKVFATILKGEMP